MSSPFPVLAQEVGDSMTIEVEAPDIDIEHCLLFFTLPWDSCPSDTDLSTRIIMQCSLKNHPSKSYNFPESFYIGIRGFLRENYLNFNALAFMTGVSLTSRQRKRW